MMRSLVKNHLQRSCLIVIITLISYSVAYAQETDKEKEITEAINEVNNGNYEKAIPILKKYAEVKGLDDFNTLKTNIYLNWCNQITENQALNIDKVNMLTDSYLAKYDISLSDSLKSIEERGLISLAAIMNMNAGNYEKQIYFLNKIKEYNEICKLQEDESFAFILNLMAYGYYQLNDYENALKIGQKACALYYDFFGEEDPDYLECLNSLALYYSFVGDYKKAIEIGIKVVELRKEVLGQENPDYLVSLSHLALFYFYFGSYREALEINIKVVELQKKYVGENDPEYLASLNNLALIYQNTFDYTRALEIYLMTAKLNKELTGEKNLGYTILLNNIATLYANLGDYQKALEVAAQAVELQKEILGEKHADYLVSLINLSTLYGNAGDNQKALEIILKVIELQKEIMNEKHPSYLSSLYNLSVLYSNKGDYKNAFRICNKVVELRKEILGEYHRDYLKSLFSLSIDEFQLLEIDSAFNHCLEMLSKTKSQIIDYLSLMTEYQRAHLWGEYSPYFDLYLMYYEKVALYRPYEAKDAYNIALFIKELLLNTTIDFSKLIIEKGTPEAITKYDELKILKRQIRYLIEQPIANRLQNLDSLNNLARRKETELLQLSKNYGDYTKSLKISWKDVQEKLHDNEVAIEFVEYPTLTDTVKYAALVVRKGWQYPQMIPLFRKDQIDEFIKQDKDKIYSNQYVGKQIKKLVWKPLEEVVSQGERVYFSPAGIIHQLALENLPVDDSTTLGDRYQMYRLSSTKELVLQKPESRGRSAVIYGGLSYDLEDQQMIAESRKYEKQDNLLAMRRGFDADSNTRAGWRYLGGTLKEAEQISHLLNEEKYQVTQLTGNAGIEESFKALSGKGNEIIHIATHGFFLPVEESRGNLFMLQRMGDERENGGVVDPMLRSGLMFAGGNRAWKGEVIPEGVEDGVLTAREISHMDLRGTDLVVLSACETGLGEVSSEGVFGLQRSFKQAGVQALVMSLWQVNDEATRYLMTEFYTGLLSSKDKREAFLDAKQKCKVKYPEPRYWAAFIMLD